MATVAMAVVTMVVAMQGSASPQPPPTRGGGAGVT